MSTCFFSFFNSFSLAALSAAAFSSASFSSLSCLSCSSLCLSSCYFMFSYCFFSSICSLVKGISFGGIGAAGTLVAGFALVVYTGTGFAAGCYCFTFAAGSGFLLKSFGGAVGSGFLLNSLDVTEGVGAGYGAGSLAFLSIIFLGTLAVISFLANSGVVPGWLLMLGWSSLCSGGMMILVSALKSLVTSYTSGFTLLFISLIVWVILGS